MLQNPLVFGIIELHPGGDAIVIEAKSGPATATSHRSVVLGSHSGLITLAASSANDEYVRTIYPDSIDLKSGGLQITLSGIAVHSQYHGADLLLPGSASPVEVSIGGELVLQGNEPAGAYSGTITIQLDYL